MKSHWSFVLSVLCCVGVWPSWNVGQAQEAGGNAFTIPATDDGLPGAGTIRRNEGFQRTWTERRRHFAERAAQDKGAVVFLGDSITQGWGDDLKGAFPGLKVANRGISGDTSRGVLIRLKDDVLSLDPAAVVLLVGTNDLADGDAPETIAGNVKLIVQQLHAHKADMPIILCGVFPSAESKSRPAARIQAVNQQLQNGFRDEKGVTFVDTYRLFAIRNGNRFSDAKEAEFPDLLHPNDLGYAKWAAAIRPVLATLGFLETEPDQFTPEEGFVSLLNGRDLTGWGLRSQSGEFTSLDGKQQSEDGRYVAKNGKMIVTTPPERSRIQMIWTEKKFPQNFILKLEFRATPDADSGIFIRDKQLQCRDYPVAGPYFDAKQYKPQDWNEVVITVNGNVAHCSCNGEVLEAAMEIPATGSIGLEGDRGQLEYRRIRMKVVE